MPQVDFIYEDDCPNVEATRRNLEFALASTGIDQNWTEHRIGDHELPPRVRGFGSPTILIDGVDVAGASLGSERCCRIYENGSGVPSTKMIIDALKGIRTKTY